MKVVIGYDASREAQQYLRTKLPADIELVGPFTEGQKDQEFLKEIKDADVVLSYTLTREALAVSQKLKLLQFPWTGVNSLYSVDDDQYDKDLATQLLEQNVTVCNSHSNALSIAEHTMSLITSASKHIVPIDHYMRKGDWRPRREGFISTLLRDSVLGIVGYGAIGKHVARMAIQGFGMKVIAIRRGENPENYSNPPVEILGGPNRLKNLLSQSDFVLITVPLTPETENMIGSEELSTMKPTSVLVNVSRGPVINQKALFEALEKRQIGGAALEVWWKYPRLSEGDDPSQFFQDFPFQTLENVILSPHRAWRVKHRDAFHLEDVVENLLRFRDGRDLINVVDLKLGY